MTENEETKIAECTERYNRRETERSHITKRLDELTEEMESLVLIVIKIRWHLTIGTIVKDKKGNLYRVAIIETRWDQMQYAAKEKPTILANPQKKDGTYGNVTRRLWGISNDWEVVTE